MITTKEFVEIILAIVIVTLHVISEKQIRRLTARLDHFCSPKKLKTDWLPKPKQLFFYIGSAGTICHERWHDTEIQQQIRSFMGIYRTEGEAIVACDSIRRDVHERHEDKPFRIDN